MNTKNMVEGLIIKIISTAVTKQNTLAIYFKHAGVHDVTLMMNGKVKLTTNELKDTFIEDLDEMISILEEV